MKYLIVNGDDFGASPGVNRGITEAHIHGILTSASLLVKTRWTRQAARLAAALPKLGVGLHADVREALAGSSPSSRGVGESLRQQFRRFEELVGHPPSHIDSHYNVHRDPRALPHFLELAREHDLPLRDHSPVRYISKFYGQWDGETHLEQISVENLERMVRSEIVDGITELSCHPGYIDQSHVTSYRGEREAELRTLCDPRIRRTLAGLRITLINHHQVAKLVAMTDKVSRAHV
jgi:chitin disaccharide deacetylase